MTIYARIGDAQLVKSGDGCVGLWNPTTRGWIERWGLGTNHAGFVRAMLELPEHQLTDVGREWLHKRVAQ